MLPELINFIIGISLLLFSTNIFISFAQTISMSLKLSPLVIGVTVVSLGTVMPEFVISTISAAKGDFGLAIGNIIGSNILNILLILSVAIFSGKLRIGTTKTQRSAILSLAATCLFSLLYISGYPGILSALILLTGAGLVTYAEYNWGTIGRGKEDKKRFFHKRSISIKPIYAFLQVFSVLGIVIGGIIAIRAVENIALISGYSTTILGLSLTAMATSLPELFITIISSNKHQEKVAIGNILGSNMYNLLLIGGIIIFFKNGYGITTVDWLFFFLASAILPFMIFKYSGRVVPQKIGVLLLTLLGFYFLILGFKL